MTNDERFDRLAIAIEKIADAQLATLTHIGFLGDQILRLSQQQTAMQQQQTAMQQQQTAMQQQQTAMQQQQTIMLQRQAEQDQRFDVLLGEIRHIVQRLDKEGSP